MGTVATTVAARRELDWGQIVDEYTLLPLAFFAIQFPLWVLRAGAGWRIVRADQQDEFSPTQFHVRHLFVATAIGVTLPVLRVARRWGYVLRRAAPTKAALP